jgi:hypothetical protein
LFDVQSPIETLVSTLLSTPQLVSTPNCFLSNKICAFLFSRRVEALLSSHLAHFGPRQELFQKNVIRESKELTSELAWESAVHA